MKKLILSLFAVLALVACEKNNDSPLESKPDPHPEEKPAEKPEEKQEAFSIVGQWKFGQFDYYFDGQLLDVHDSIINVWELYHGNVEPCGVVSQGQVEFAADSTGMVRGVGEYETDSVPFTYSTVNGKYVISMAGGLATLDFERDSVNNDMLVNTAVKEHVYGWMSNAEFRSKSEPRPEPHGYDGTDNHTLTTVSRLKRI